MPKLKLGELEFSEIVPNNKDYPDFITITMVGVNFGKDVEMDIEKADAEQIIAHLKEQFKI